MVDYSKWDAMKFSDSDSEGSDNDGDDGPRVTSLNQPGRVTIGTDGNIQIGQSSPGSSSTHQQQREDDNDLPVVSGSISGNAVDISSLPNAAADSGKNIAQQKQKREEKLTRNGGKHTTTISTFQPPLHLPVYWSQDRYVVTLRVGFPTTQFPSRTIRVKVVGALKYEDRHSAVGSGSMMTDYISKQSDDDGIPSYGSVTIVSESGNDQEIVLFTGLLPRPIHLNQDEDEVEFEIENSGIANNDDVSESCFDRFVSITMTKAVPMQGLVLWWDCPIIGFPKIDVSSIKDRKVSSDAKSSSSKDDNNSNIAKKEAFQKAWDEAHEMFREKMKKKEKQTI
ncbi:hypothetical protein ACHAWT_010273 [Skeletonema menzelii]